MSRPARHTVFISYSHSDEYWKNRLVTHLGVLEHQGLLDLWDDRRIGVGEDWRAQIERTISSATVAVLLISADFLTSRFILDDEVPPLLQRRDKEGMRIIPVIVRPCAWQSIGWLREMQIFPKDAKPLSAGNKNRVEANLASIASQIHAQLESGLESAAQKSASSQTDQTYFSNLPHSGNNLIGRDQELKRLDDALDTDQVNVVCMVGQSGVGKTALLSDWLTRIRRDRSQKVAKIYAWSFYNQGSGDEAASGDLFIQSALKWLGDEDTARGSPWNKGERLANLLRAEKTLLLLVGVELLQYKAGPQQGLIMLATMQALLQKMVKYNPGLCVLCTTLPVLELTQARQGAVEYIELAPLSPQSGAQVLRAKAVSGNDAELQQASAEFGGHPLALTLLGSFLSDVHTGSTIIRSQVTPAENQVEIKENARRVLAAYRSWFGEGPELCVLRMVGLFDRPSDSQAIAALRTSPSILGFTDALRYMTHAGWQWVLLKLRRARLLFEPDPEQPDTLDAHPLVREFFRQNLIEEHPDSWREGNNRLFTYFKQTAKQYPDDIWEMQPIKLAIIHGCRAGRYQEALEDVYCKRIRRGSEEFITEKLSTHGENLAMLSNFFVTPWLQPVTDLSKNAKSFLLNETALSLQAVGRLVEAAQAMQSELTLNTATVDRKDAAIAAGNLSELYLTLGNLAQALSYAQYSVDLADLSGDEFERMSKRATLAYALQQSGHLSNAEAVFAEAEQIQRTSETPLSNLRSPSGLRYVNLLLTRGDNQQVHDKLIGLSEGRQTSEITLDLALEHLSLGHNYLQQAKDGTGNYAHAEAHLNQAVSALRQIGPHHHLPAGLLIRAELFTLMGAFDQAMADLDEALSIAIRGDMGLYMVDCHLAYAWVYLAKGEKHKAEDSVILARKLIERTGYHWRDENVAEIEKKIAEAEPGSK